MLDIQKYKTIQISDREEFDNEVNEHLEIGWKILEGGYEIIEENGKNIYSQVIYLGNDVEIVYHENGDINSIHNLNNAGKHEGRYTIWWGTNQQKYEQGNIIQINDTSYNDGQFKSWFENGQLKETGCFYNGIRGGNWKSFYEDNSIKYEGMYFKWEINFGLNDDDLDFIRTQSHWRDEGVKSGLWKENYSNGQKKFKGEFSGRFRISKGNVNNLFSIPIGKYTIWYENGAIEETAYSKIDGNEDGTFTQVKTDIKRYGEDGSLENEIDCITTEGTGYYIEEKYIGWEKEYIYNELSKEKKYNENGQEIEYHLYKDGGKTTSYYKRYYGDISEVNKTIRYCNYGPLLIASNPDNDYRTQHRIVEILSYHSNGKKKSTNSFYITFNLWFQLQSDIITRHGLQRIIKFIIDKMKEEEKFRYGKQIEYDEDGNITFEKDWGNPLDWGN